MQTHKEGGVLPYMEESSLCKVGLPQVYVREHAFVRYLHTLISIQHAFWFDSEARGKKPHLTYLAGPCLTYQGNEKAVRNVLNPADSGVDSGYDE
jgi:hypothetical protein